MASKFSILESILITFFRIMCNKVLGSNKSCVVIGISDKISLELEADKLIGLRSESRALGRADPGPVWFLRARLFLRLSLLLSVDGSLTPYRRLPFPLSPYREFFPQDSCISRKTNCLAQSLAAWGVRELQGGKMSHP